MVLRYQNYPFLRGAITLWGLSALFVLVRCSVPERDYSLLNIGEVPGGGGEGGSAGEGSAGASAGQSGGGQAGQDGFGGDGGLGGQGGAPPVPIPCNTNVVDAGAEDAGITDAGIADAGGEDASASEPNPNPYGADCACVDGFIKAIDADGDGAGTRACTFAPGLDCDDNDGAVTHNNCGGCSALPNTVGADCLDCGAYVCDGPDSVICATKPDAVVVDPDCRCLNGEFAARDTDGDGAGTRLCEAAPGNDCNDGDPAYQANACGGCEAPPGALGAPCNLCGAYVCNGTAIVCAPAQAPRCQGTEIRETCVGTGFWEQTICAPNVCYAGNCEVCTPGTFMCGAPNAGSTILYQCGYSSAYSGIGWISDASCTAAQTCEANLGQCTGSLLLPRDNDFDVVPLLKPGLPWHDLLNTAGESDYG